MWGTSTNWEARVRVLETWLSRCSKVPDRRRGEGVATAKAVMGSTNNKTAGQVRGGISLPVSSGSLLAWSGKCRTTLAIRVCLCSGIGYRREFTDGIPPSERNCITGDVIMRQISALYHFVEPNLISLTRK